MCHSIPEFFSTFHKLYAILNRNVLSLLLLFHDDLMNPLISSGWKWSGDFHFEQAVKTHPTQEFVLFGIYWKCIAPFECACDEFIPFLLLLVGALNGKKFVHCLHFYLLGGKFGYFDAYLKLINAIFLGED